MSRTYGTLVIWVRLFSTDAMLLNPYGIGNSLYGRIGGCLKRLVGNAVTCLTGLWRDHLIFSTQMHQTEQIQQPIVIRVEIAILEGL